MHPGKSRDSPASKSTGSSRVNQLLKLPTQAMDLVHYFVLRKSWDIPSGNLSHNYGKSPCFMGKFTRNGGLSISDATNYQRLVDLVETHPTKKKRKNRRSSSMAGARRFRCPVVMKSTILRGSPARKDVCDIWCIYGNVPWNLWKSIQNYICDEWTFGVYICNNIYIYFFYTQQKLYLTR